MIIRNVYGVSGGNQDILAGTVLRLRSDLMAYYANLPSDVRSTVTQVEDLTIKMLGSRAKPKLKTKAPDSVCRTVVERAQIQNDRNGDVAH